MTNKNDEVCVKVLGNILTQIEQGTLPWHKPWNAKPPVNAITNKPYKGINNLVLSLSEYTDNRWITFNQAKELGGQIKKGEHHTGVVWWHWPNRTQPNDPTTTTTNDPTNTTTKSWDVVWARYFMVFNVEQCSGLNLPELPATNSINANPIESAQAIHVNYLTNGGPRITHGGNVAAYSPMFDYIQLPKLNDFDSPNDYHCTRFHEEVHSTGHTSRLNRSLTAYYEDKQEYGVEELIAELGAAMLCAISNLNKPVNNSASYIASWQSKIKADNTMLVRAASRAQAAVDLITRA